MKNAIIIVLSMVCSATVLGQNTCTSNGTGGGDWDDASTWVCTGGVTEPSDGTVNTISILAGDNVEINDLGEGVGYLSGAVTMNIDGTLSFAGVGTLSLPGGSVINVASGGLIDAADFFGTPDLLGTITIGSIFNVVWSPFFGIGGGDLTGPGSLDGTSSGVLPILLVYFSAESQTNHVTLNWLTAAEENNDYFTIERSSNGLDFKEIATVQGAGTSFEALEYAYVDNAPSSGVSYYRLKQTDYDGTSETFKVVATEFYGESIPVKVFQHLKKVDELYVRNNLDEENTAYIYDMSGRSYNVGQLTKGENTLSLDQLGLGNGLHVMKVYNALGNPLAVQKFIVR